MTQERKYKFIAFVVGTIATIAVLSAIVERSSHHKWKHGCYSSQQEYDNSGVED